MEVANAIDHFEILIRLFLGAILGGLIGVEREQRNGFAGLRTHMLVCVGATLIMIVSQYGFYSVIEQQVIILDPSRVAAQVVSGIGFLGAGTILIGRNIIRGLTTAASLWAVAALGLAIGGGLYIAAFGTTVLILVILAGLKPLENLLFKKDHVTGLKIEIKPGAPTAMLEKLLKKSLLDSGLINLSFEVEEDSEVIYLTFRPIAKTKLLKIIDQIKVIKEIKKVELLE